MKIIHGSILVRNKEIILLTTCGDEGEQLPRGYFDNMDLIISKFASDLQLEINTDLHGIQISDCDLPTRRFFPDTMTQLQLLQHIIELSGKLSQEIELLYSKRQGQTNFCIMVKNLMKQYTELVHFTYSTNKPEGKGNK